MSVTSFSDALMYLCKRLVPYFALLLPANSYLHLITNNIAYCTYLRRYKCMYIDVDIARLRNVNNN